MAIKKEAKRVRTGQKLTDIEAGAMSAISSLKSYKVQIVTLKQTVNNDTDFTPEDEQEVQDLIDKLQTEISSI